MLGQSCCCVYHLWATDSACCTVKECLYGSCVQQMAHVAAVSSQLCIVAVSCCAGSMVMQLLYWLGVAGYEWHVKVRGLVFNQ